jgi:hypothetical protein
LLDAEAGADVMHQIRERHREVTSFTNLVVASATRPYGGDPPSEAAKDPVYNS